MASLTAALYVALYQEEKSAHFHDFKCLGSPIEFLSSQGAVYLLHLSRELFCNIGAVTNLNTLVDFLKTKFVRLETNRDVLCKSQVTIFSFETGQILERYPREYDDTCRQLWLCGSMNKGKVAISAVITDIYRYLERKKFGFFCFYCEKYFSGKGSKHRCRKRQSCFACHRPLLQLTTYTTKNNFPYFCPSNMEPREKSLCKKCNVTIYNEACFKIHDKKNCRWGWFCLTCNQYTFRSKYLKTVQIIKQTHICFTCFCSFCGERIQILEKKYHLCPLLKLKPPQMFTKIAFLQMNFRGSSPAWCSDCTSEKVCTFCTGNTLDEQPNIGVLLVENKMGHFDSYTFCDPDLEDKISCKKDILIMPYLPSFAMKQYKEKNDASFGVKRVKVHKTLFEKNETVIGQILNFILQKDFSNTTILVNCSESNEPIFIVAFLVEKGFLPQVLKQNGRIMLIECQEIGLRLLDSQNYFKATITELARNALDPFIYFPRKWNKSNLYEYEGLIPPVKDFLYFEDTVSDIEAKKKYVKAFQGKWALKTNLVKNTNQKVLLNAKCILQFISSAFEIQKELFLNISEKNNEYSFLHPLNRPLLTFSSFAYQLFLMISDSDLRMMNRPIEYNSSKGEIEFASFLEYIFDRNIEYCWSPYGQSKHFLPISVPDIYDKKTQTLYYYNGCYIHGHFNKCRFVKTQTHQNESSKGRNMSFYEKMAKLSFHPEVKKIKVIWQCSWVHAKKTDPKVKDFMQNVYKNPPTYRLDARNAGKPRVKPNISALNTIF